MDSEWTSPGGDGGGVFCRSEGDALCDPRHELRRVALHHLPDARSKLVEDVDPSVAADCRAKIVGCPEVDRAQYGR
jgi:hypothetical protein